MTVDLEEIRRCGRPKTNGKPCMRRGGPCFEHETAEEKQSSLEWAQQEVKRRGAVERDWLGETTQGRPGFAHAEGLDREGVPSCHVWAVPQNGAPAHLSAIDALRRWQAGACALCSASGGGLLVDHDHRTGLVRGLLCASCNTAEGLQGAASFVAYRERPPAVILGVEEQYGAPWDGFGLHGDAANHSNAAHVDAGEALFAGIIDRFRPGV